MLDTPEGICEGQAGFEYPATSVPFSNLRPRLRQDCGSQVGQTPTRWVSDLSPVAYASPGSDATMATDNANSYNADEEIEFAISMAAMLRTAARAADEFGVSCRVGASLR